MGIATYSSVYDLYGLCITVLPLKTDRSGLNIDLSLVMPFTVTGWLVSTFLLTISYYSRSDILPTMPCSSLSILAL